MEEYEEYLPIIISYDEEIDMWSYQVGDEAGVADTRSELIDKIWDLVYDWKNRQ